MNYFYKHKTKKAKIHNTIFLILYGISYTPLNENDKKTMFSFKKIYFLQNCWILKFLIFDLRIVLIPNINNYTPKLETVSNQ